MRKEIRKRILLGYHDSIRHAQAQGLARRIQSAAELRSRHRAWEFAICSQDDWVVGSSVIWGQHSGAGDQSSFEASRSSRARTPGRWNESPESAWRAPGGSVALKEL